MKIIKVGAVWCPACLVMASRINKIVDKYKLELVNYDYDIDNDIVNKYNVGNILPILILVDDNEKEIGRLTGEQSIKKLEEFIEK